MKPGPRPTWRRATVEGPKVSGSKPSPPTDIGKQRPSSPRSGMTTPGVLDAPINGADVKAPPRPTGRGRRASLRQVQASPAQSRGAHGPGSARGQRQHPRQAHARRMPKRLTQLGIFQLIEKRGRRGLDHARVACSSMARMCICQRQTVVLSSLYRSASRRHDAGRSAHIMSRTTSRNASGRRNPTSAAARTGAHRLGLRIQRGERLGPGANTRQPDAELAHLPRRQTMKSEAEPAKAGRVDGAHRGRTGCSLYPPSACAALNTQCRHRRNVSDRLEGLWSILVHGDQAAACCSAS